MGITGVVLAIVKSSTGKMGSLSIIFEKQVMSLLKITLNIIKNNNNKPRHI